MNYELQRQADSIKFQNKEDKYKYKIAKRTLDCLISCADEEGDTFVGFEFIAGRICSCIQTVYNHFIILESLSILKTKKIGNKMVKTISFGSIEGSIEGSILYSNQSSIETSIQSSSPLEANISNIIEVSNKDVISSAKASVCVDEKIEEEDGKPSSKEILELWNEYAIEYGFKKIFKVDTTRRNAFLRLIKTHGEDNFYQAIENASNSKFLTGKTSSPFVLTFDWFMKPSNFKKVLEGNYNQG